MALGVVRDGGVVSRVGAAQYTEVPMDFGTFMRNITLTGGVAPARAYIEELHARRARRLDRAGPGVRPQRSAWMTCRTATGPWPSAGP